jgi:nucleotide-binding universal stress UspA family protein
MFTHILVPTDFSPTANRALDAALEMAERFGSLVSILHVYEPTQPVPYGDGVIWPTGQIERLARDALDELVERAQERYPACNGILKPPGAPSDAIIAGARECGADVIVMGTHGRRGFAHLMLGSTAERVVRTSPIPVLTLSTRGEAGTERNAVAERLTRAAAAPDV